MAIILIKLAVTAAACAWILSLVNWTQFWNTVRGATHGILVAVVVMRFGGLTLSAYKWQQLLALHGPAFPLGRLVRWYLVATFLNHFLPTSIGGDAFRVYRTLHNQRSRSCAVFAVLMERATGLLALLALGLAAGLLALPARPDAVVRVVTALCGAGIGLGLAAVWLGPRLIRWEWLPGRGRWGGWLGQIAELAADFRRQPRRSALIAALSFLFHLNKLCAAWLVLYALGAPLDPLGLTLTVVAVEVIGLLPISLGGLGIVDGSFIYLAGWFGVGAEPALAAMLLLRVLNLPLSLAGAYFYVLGDRAPAEAPGAPPQPVAGPVAPGRAIL